MALALLDLAIPGAGSVVSVLTSIGQLCLDVKESQAACARVHRRLEDILHELQLIHNAGCMPHSDALARYKTTLVGFERSLRRYCGLKFVSRVMQYSRMMGELKLLHEDIDTLMKLFQLSTAGALLDWRQQWKADNERQQQTLATLMENEAYILTELKDKRSQVEAMTLLKHRLDRSKDQQDDFTLRVMQTAHTTIVRASKASVPSVPPWFLSNDEIEVDAEPFSKGSFGSVHRGEWGAGTKIVVKRLHGSEGDGSLSDAALQSFMDEIKLWHTLKHPHVLVMYGACHVTQPPFIVCEDAIHGTLASFLRKTKPGKQRMWLLLQQAASGLKYIHTQNIVHGDLKINNLLVGSDGTARVADFGLSSFKDPRQARATSAVESGGVRWRAPERLAGHPATFESDVYAFAMCIIEAATDSVPFGLKGDEEVIAMKQAGEIPSRPDSMREDEWELIVQMTALEPSKRLDLVSVTKSLKVFAERQCEQEAAASPPPSPTRLAAQPEGGDTAKTEPAAKRDIPMLVAGLASGDESVRKDSVTRLYRCLTTEAACQAVVDSKGVVPLTKMVELSAAAFHCQLYAFGCLHALSTSLVGISTAEVGASSSLVRKASGSDLMALSEWLAVDASSDGEQCLTALDMLCCLARVGSDNCDQIRVEGLIPRLVLVATKGTDDQKVAAAHAIAAVASHNEANQAVLVGSGGVPLLAELMRTGSVAQQCGAASALASIAGSEANRELVAQTDIVDLLLDRLRSGDESQRTSSLLAVASLAGCEAVRSRVLEADSVVLLVESLANGTKQQKQLGALTVIVVATNNESACSALVLAGAVAPLVLLARCDHEVLHVYATRAIQSLASSETHATTVVLAGAADLLVPLLLRGTDMQKQNVALAIARLATEGKDSDVVPSAGAEPLVDDQENGDNIQTEESSDDKETVTTLREDSVTPLVVLLSTGSAKRKEKAVVALTNLAFCHANRVLIAAAGSVAPLATLVANGTEKQKECAAILLSNLAMAKKNRVLIAAAAGAALVTLVRSGTEAQKDKAAMALANMASTNEASRVIAESGGVEALIKLLQKGSEKQKDKAVGAVGNLAYWNGTHGRIIEAGGVKAIIQLLRVGTPKHKEKAAIVLSNLAFVSRNHAAIVKGGGIAPLVALLQSGTPIQVEKAACAFVGLAHGEHTPPLISQAGAVELLVALARHGTEKQKEKAARALANLSQDALVSQHVVRLWYADVPALEKLFPVDADAIKHKADASLAALGKLKDTGSPKSKLSSPTNGLPKKGGW